MARTDKLLFGLALGFGLFAAILLFDLVPAMFASSCVGAGAGVNCYPWGAEGPATGNWRYTSKSVYIGSGVTFIVLVGGAIALLLQSQRRDQPLSRERRTCVIAALIVAFLLLVIG